MSEWGGQCDQLTISMRSGARTPRQSGTSRSLATRARGAIPTKRYETSGASSGNNEDTTERPPFAEIVVVGAADLFELVRGLELGVPLWRVRGSGPRQLSEDAILLLDLRGLSDSDAVGGVRSSASRSATIAVSHPLGTADALGYLEAGAFGAIDPASADSMALRRSLLGALRGEPAFTREVLGLWLHRIRHESRSTTWHLTARQREVMTLVAGGSTDREISETLNISLATAQKHVANVLKRLGASNRAAAVNIALMASLIRPGAAALERRPR